jgi:predicted small lipoprotein YifL
MARNFAVAVLGCLLAACGSIGPVTVPHDRIDYASAIGNSWKEQTLLNIVKLRYSDMPVFLEVAQVIAGYQLQSTFGASFTAGNFNASLIGPFTASGNATAAGTYTDRPTVVYQPLTGVDFLKRLMTPIPPTSVLFVLQSGYSAERVMPIMLASVNGLINGSNRFKRKADPRFIRLVKLVGEAQLADTIQIRIVPGKEGPESSVVAFPPRQDPAAIARRQEITSLLGLNPDLQEFNVYYGAYAGKPDEIDMKTRSMLEIMLEFATAVQVPEADVLDGKALPGAVSSGPAEPASGATMRIRSGDAAPKDASVAVQYNDRWFWVADTDIQSKTTFGVLMLLFSIAETGIKGSAPVVTIPANQ